MSKRRLFEIFMERMITAEAAGMQLESVWYAYVILEDRLVSMLRNSGGENFQNGKPIQMLGNKINELRKRTANDSLLAAYFPEHDVKKEQTALWKWKNERNELMHGMANGTMTLVQIDMRVAKVAKDGAQLAREYCSAAALMKRHRSKVPL